MWKVSFKNDYKKVERFNDKATVVTLQATVKMPKNFARSIPVEVLNWMLKHTNPKVDINILSSRTIVIKSKGKAVRSDEDKDNPLFAERLAECRAKMKIYQFLTTLMERYGKYYWEILIGKDKTLYPAKDSDEPSKDSVAAMQEKYYKLWGKEYELLTKLKDGE